MRLQVNGTGQRASTRVRTVELERMRDVLIDDEAGAAVARAVGILRRRSEEAGVVTL